MSQTQLNYNTLFFGVKGEPARIKRATVLSGEGDLSAGTVVIFDETAGKWICPDATTQIQGWGILLEDAAAASADVDGVAIGLSGGINEEDLLFGGTIAAFSEIVRSRLAVNNIYVQSGTNAMSVAGE